MRLPAFSIRAYHRHDIPAYFGAVRESIQEVYPWQPWCHPEYDLADSTRWVISRRDAWVLASEFSFLVCKTVDGRIAGGININRIDWAQRTANVSFWTRTSFTREGAASIAVRLVAEFAKRQLHLRALYLMADVANTASRRVAEKAGARLLMNLPGALYYHGVRHDAVLYWLVVE